MHKSCDNAEASCHSGICASTATPTETRPYHCILLWSVHQGRCQELLFDKLRQSLYGMQQQLACALLFFILPEVHYRLCWCWDSGCISRCVGNSRNSGQLWQWLAHAVHYQLCDGVGVHWWTGGRFLDLSDSVGAPAKLCHHFHTVIYLWSLLCSQCHSSTWWDMHTHAWSFPWCLTCQERYMLHL